MSTGGEGNYIVDTAYLENGRRNISEFTFKVGYVAVYKPRHVLPYVFVLHEQQFIPVTVSRFTSDEVIINVRFIEGDSAVLKTSYYRGWKVNDEPAMSNGNVVWKKLSRDSSSVRFSFEPLDYRTGVVLSLSGIIVIALLLYKRRMIDSYLGDWQKDGQDD